MCPFARATRDFPFQLLVALGHQRLGEAYIRPFFDVFFISNGIELVTT